MKINFTIRLALVVVLVAVLFPGRLEAGDPPQNLPPKVKLTSPENGLTIRAPSKLLLSAEASDPEGKLKTVAFFINGELFSSIPVLPDAKPPARFEASWSVDAGARLPATYILHALAVDTAGLRSTSGPVTVKVVTGPEENKPPTASVLDPKAGGAFWIADGALTFRATASDPDGKLAKIEFLVDRVVVSTQSDIQSGRESFTGIWKTPVPGKHTVQVRVTDERGATFTSEGVAFEALLPNQPPRVSVAWVGTEMTFVSSEGVYLIRTPNTTNLTISASAIDPDPGDSVKRFELVINGKVVVVKENAGTRVQMTAERLGVGVYEVVVRAVDSHGAVGIGTLPRTSRIRVVPSVMFNSISGVSMEAAGGVFIRSETVTANVVIRSEVSPAPALDRIEILMNGEKILTLGTEKLSRAGAGGWSVPVTLKGLKNGSWTFHAVLRGVEGGVMYSGPLVLHVALPPVTWKIEITAPKDGHSVELGTVVGVAAAAKQLTEGRTGEIVNVQFVLRQQGKADKVLKTDTRPPYSVEWKPEIAGRYELIAIAKDRNGGEFRSAPVRLTVNEPRVAATIALTSPKEGSVYSAGDTVPVEAKVEVQGTKVKEVRFYARLEDRKELLLKVDGTVPYSTSWKAAGSGKVQFYATALLTNGKTVESTVTTITMKGGNLPPAVEILTPKTGSNFDVGVPIEFTAKASDPDGKVDSVRYYIDEELVAVAPRAPYRLLWSLFKPGEYVVTAVATDNQGAKTTSSKVVIKIQDPATRNLPPKVDIVSPVSGSTFDQPLVRVKVQAADSDGYIPKMELLDNGKVIDSEVRQFLVKPKPGELAEFVFEVSRWSDMGVHRLQARAFDDRGASTLSSVVEIKIVEVNALPVVQVEAVEEFVLESGVRGSGAFKITRSGSTKLPLVARYAVRGTASPGVDYKAIPAFASIPAGESSVLVKIEPIPDKAIENRESVTLTLVTGVGAGSPTIETNYKLGEKNSAILWIVETIEDTVKRTIVNVKADKGAASIDSDQHPFFVFSRSGDLSVAVDVHYRVGGTAVGGVHYEKLDGKVTFPKGVSDVWEIVKPTKTGLGKPSLSVIVTIDPAICIEIFPPPPSCYVIGQDSKATINLLEPAKPEELPVITIGGGQIVFSNVSGVTMVPLSTNQFSLAPGTNQGILMFSNNAMLPLNSWFMAGALELSPLSVHTVSGQKVSIVFFGEPFGKYMIEYSDDQGKNWVPVAITESGTGLFTFEDTTGSSKPNRMYRALRVL